MINARRVDCDVRDFSHERLRRRGRIGPWREQSLFEEGMRCGEEFFVLLLATVVKQKLTCDCDLLSARSHRCVKGAPVVSLVMQIKISTLHDRPRSAHKAEETSQLIHLLAGKRSRSGWRI